MKSNEYIDFSKGVQYKVGERPAKTYSKPKRLARFELIKKSLRPVAITT